MAGKRPPAPRFKKHLRAAYRSGLEVAIATALSLAKVPFTYETYRVPFVQPEKQRHYCPDYTLPNGIIVEAKGLWDADDRAKHDLVRDQHPDLEIRMVFSNPAAKLRKGSPTTYASWCDKRGIKYAKRSIPEEWLKEPPHEKSLAALAQLGWTPSSSTQKMSG